MHKLYISEQLSGEWVNLDLRGDLIFGEGISMLRAEMRRLLGESQNKIILNFKDVGFVDSSGVGELISALTAVNRAEGQLKLVNLSPRVYRLLEISKLLTVFNIHEHETSATTGRL